ncbi:MAG: polyprenyl synthetase family protein [Candidatus Heimdallarchaeota archaeon]|nr:polyprenyl synthetase family protein [Candidatus Heimdallarchaeota archaeon]
MEQQLDLFAEDRITIESWISDLIEEEYQDSIMKKMILPMFAANKGKKLRPLIAVYMYRILNGEDKDSEGLKAISSALEISHNASLIVDDVFDKDMMRRGEPSFFVKYGTFAALSGAYNLSAFVFDLATRTDNHTIVREVGRVGSALSAALFMSKDLVSNNVVSKQYFMDILYRKTSVLFMAASKCGALLSTDDEEIIEKATKFGRNFGDAYQLRDDVLGIVGTMNDLGKLPVSDIENRFQSLITIYAMQMASENDKKILNAFYLRNDDVDIETIRAILVRSGAVQRVIDETLKIRNEALEILDTFEDSPSKHKLQKLVFKINFKSVQI